MRIFRFSSRSVIALKASCALMSTTASTWRACRKVTVFSPKCFLICAGLTIGSHANTLAPNCLRYRTTSTARVLRKSGTFSLKVRPSTQMLAFFGRRPAATSSRMASSPTYSPMPSLIRRPARMTSGW